VQSSLILIRKSKWRCEFAFEQPFLTKKEANSKVLCAFFWLILFKILI